MMLPRFSLLLLTALLSTAISGCGQTGDLYLRDKPPAGYKPPKPKPPVPTPYPAEPVSDAADGRRN